MKAHLKTHTVDVEEFTKETAAAFDKTVHNLFVEAGDVLVTFPNGAQQPMKRAYFDSIYEIEP